MWEKQFTAASVSNNTTSRLEMDSLTDAVCAQSNQKCHLSSSKKYNFFRQKDWGKNTCSIQMEFSTFLSFQIFLFCLLITMRLVTKGTMKTGKQAAVSNIHFLRLSRELQELPNLWLHANERAVSNFLGTFTQVFSNGFRFFSQFSTFDTFGLIKQPIK